jgi:putative MATE family efflux protein
MSLPMMASMLVQALYNIVDSLFVARISDYALAAVSQAFPIQNLMIAVSTGTAVGINAVLSRSLGEKKQDEANSTAMNALFLAVLSYALFFVFGIFGSEAFFKSQTDIPEIIDAGSTYIRICTVASIGLFGGITADRLLQSTGRTLYTMYTQLTGAIINIILDPILIFGLFGFPKMGIAGAAWATVIGQICGLILSCYFNLKKNHEITFQFRNFRPNPRVIKRIYSVGFPSIIMASISSVMTYGMNSILYTFSYTAATVLGVYFKLQSFIFMPIFGLNNGMVPIIAYNYGARKKERIIKTIKISIVYASAIMAFGFILFQTIPAQLLSLFKASDQMLEIGIPAMRIISIHFIMAGASIIMSSTFQALGNGIMSLITSLVRQLVVILPVAYLLSRIRLGLIWFSFPIAEVVSLTLCLLFLSKLYKTEIKHLG